MVGKGLIALSFSAVALGYRTHKDQGELGAAVGMKTQTPGYVERFGANFSLIEATNELKTQMCDWYFKADAHPHGVVCQEWVDKNVVIEDGPLITARAGDPSKPWVVFIHGWPDTAAIWVNQFMRLYTSHYCVAVQLPNYLDALPTEELYLDEVTARIAEVWQGHGKVPLVGHDWGANFGYMVAYKFPDQVEKYAAVDIGNDIAMWHDSNKTHGNRTWMGLGINLYQKALADGYVNPIRGAAIAYISSRGTPSNHATARMGMYYYHAWNRDEFCRRMAPDVDPADWQSLWTPLPGTGIPQPGMLYLQGSTLATTKKFTDAVVADGGKVVAWENLGHWLPKDGAAETNRVLAEWLGDKDEPKTPSYDVLSYTACNADILKKVYQSNYVLTGDRRWKKKSFYAKCDGTEGPTGKISCVPKECEGADWCFVQPKCGGWFNACKKQEPLACPVAPSL